MGYGRDGRDGSTLLEAASFVRADAVVARLQCALAKQDNALICLWHSSVRQTFTNVLM